MERGHLIEIDNLTYYYPEGNTPALRDIQVNFNDGENVLLYGPSGCGKSTLLRALNGLVPLFYGGKLVGRVTVDDKIAVENGPRAFAGEIGFLFQAPETQLVMTHVHDEIQFGMENLGLSISEMNGRMDRIVDEMEIRHLLGRKTNELSGGEQQLVLLSSILALNPKYIVLDEPTSQLDAANAKRLLEVLETDPSKDRTIVICDHRLQRVRNITDRVLLMNSGRIVEDGSLESVETKIEVAQPQLRTLHPKKRPILRVDDLQFSYGEQEIINDLSFEIEEGELVGIVGPNGSGKSTLLRLIFGFLRPSGGSIKINGLSENASPAERSRLIGYVCQSPEHYLFSETVEQEMEFTLKNQNVPPEEWEERKLSALQMLDLQSFLKRFPRDLSAGEKVRVAIASVLVNSPKILLLDEITRGIDIWKKNELKKHLNEYCYQGGTVVIATHDNEFLEGITTRTIQLPQNEIMENAP